MTFRYKDYNDNDKTKFMTLKVFEFIRRFLLHVLPNKFVRIRYYGLLSNRYRKTNLNHCRLLLKVSSINYNNLNKEESWQEIYLRLTGEDIRICPKCGQGKMITKEILRYIRPSPA